MKCEDKIAELQAELQAFRSQVQYIIRNTRFNYSTMPRNLAYYGFKNNFPFLDEWDRGGMEVLSIRAFSVT